VLALAKGGTLLYSGGYDHCIKVPRPWNRWVTLELFALPPREHAVLAVLAPPGPDETRSARTKLNRTRTKLNRTHDGPAAGQIWDAAAPDLAEAGAAGAAGAAVPLHLQACRLPPPAAPRSAPAPKAAGGHPRPRRLSICGQGGGGADGAFVGDGGGEAGRREPRGGAEALAQHRANPDWWKLPSQLPGGTGLVPRLGVTPPPPPSPSRTNWTHLVPPPVLTGHNSPLLPY
jgi:hypothetical protein